VPLAFPVEAKRLVLAGREKENMGEGDLRGGRGVRKKLWTSLGAAGWVGTVVLVLAIASAANGAVGPPVVVKKAPYKGADSVYQSTTVTTCAKASFTKPVGFSFTTGKGSLGQGSASAKICGKPFAGMGTYFYGGLSAQIGVATSVVLPGGAHAVTANWGLNWNVSGSYTYTTCPSAKPFHTSYSYTSSTYAYWDNYSGKQSVCTSDLFFELYMFQSYIQDLTNGSVTPAAGCASTYCFQQLVFNSSYTTNESGWEFYNYTSWSSSSGYTYSAGKFSLNYTHVGPNSLNSVGAKAVPQYINGTFNRAHQYAMIFEVDGFAQAEVAGWNGGSAAIHWNWAPSGGGFNLNSIVIA
jgi:hypothetical protein